MCVKCLIENILFQYYLKAKKVVGEVSVINDGRVKALQEIQHHSLTQ